MSPREGPEPAPKDVCRPVARRIAGAYFLFALAWVAVSDLALMVLTSEIPDFAGASLVKGGAFVLVTTALLYLLVARQFRSRVVSAALVPEAVSAWPARFSPAILFGGFAGLAVALVIVMFSIESRRHHEEEHNDLHAILELKADQVEMLLKQKEFSARSYARSRGLRGDLTRLAQRFDPKIVAGISERIEELRHDLEFDAVVVLDGAGNPVAAAGDDGFRGLSPELVARAARSMASGVPVAHYLHRDDQLPGAPVMMDYITPLAATSAGQDFVGALVLRETARRRLYRLIEGWPTPSPTAEILLVRRDGDHVLYLSDVRHTQDTAFRMRKPLSEASLAEVVAVTAAGPMLMDEAKDYRGEVVVAASRAIAGTDWFMIGKIDGDEILMALRRNAFIWLVSILFMILLAIGGVTALWRQQILLATARERLEAAGRRRAEGRLSEAEDRFRALFERSLDCVFLADLKGNFLDANQAALDLLGYRREEIPTVSFRTLLVPEDLPRALDALERALRTNSQPPAQEYRIRRKDGSIIVIETRSSIVFDDTGPCAVQGIARDVTERKRAEEALRESEERFRQIADNIREVFWLTDPAKNRMLYVSPAYEIIWGRSRDTLYGAPASWLDAIHPEDRDRVAHAALHDQAAGNYDEEYRIVRPDGTVRWIHDEAFPVRSPSGEVFRVAGVAEDITERKLAEAAERESEQRFRAIVEQSISGFYMIQDGRFTYVNSRFAEIFGYAAPCEVIGKTPSDLTAPKDRATVAGNIQRRMTGEVKDIAYSFTGRHKDGSEFDVGVHGSFAVYEGRPAVIGLLQDISERKHAEEESRHYIERLKQAMQSTINVVATIGERRDPYTHGHERRVGEIAAAIATEMGLQASQVEGVRIAGYLHDVGKIAVPAEILSKPTRLTKAEFDLVKEHAQQGYEILRTVPFPWPVAEAAWQHHERFDGSGYPRGLKGEEILPEARILAVADTIEAMASHRPYRPGLGLEKALAEIESNRGKLYCPRVADACLRLFREKGHRLSQ